nr:LacI family DNA-binding transcriptional regulator [Feifania hominis]
MEAVRELGYRPNRLAVSLVTKKSNTLGLIIPDNSNVFFAELSKGVEVAARKLGYNLIYGNTNNKSKRDLDYIRVFIDRGVDGIIFTRSAGTDPDDERACIDLLLQSGVCFMTMDRVIGNRAIYSEALGRMISSEDIFSVALDHVKGGYLATRHLIDLGHRRIGCVSGPAGLTTSDDRLLGYQQALEEAGIPYDPALIFEGDYEPGSGATALPYLLGRNVTAIFAFNDMMAFGIYREVHNFNLSIPDDLSVVGFDDIFFSEIIQPPLTTLRQPVFEMGTQVVNELVDLINGVPQGELQRHIRFEPTLQVRGSTAKVRKEEERI